MTYKDAIISSMGMLAKDSNTIFIGYNILYGSKAYGTLKDVPMEMCLETPVAENLMAGLAMGMALEGFRPVLFFERHDFMLNALDQIANHIDKISDLSEGQYSVPVIIRATAGAKEPLDPGPQHTQDFTNVFKTLLNFPVLDLKTSEEVLEGYLLAKSMTSPILVVERRALYDRE